MKISTRARYGMRLMLELALNYGQGPQLLGQISRRQEISEKYLGQLILPLKAGGLVTAFRGSRGGYQLARPPQKIKLLEIFETLEGSLNLVDCILNSGSCRRHDGCVTRLVWGKINSRVKETLNSVTLAELVKMQKNGNKKFFNYEI